MLDVGFSELALIMIVALIVFGPERLPQVAKTAGKWFVQWRKLWQHLQQEAELALQETDADSEISSKSNNDNNPELTTEQSDEKRHA